MSHDIKQTSGNPLVLCLLYFMHVPFKSAIIRNILIIFKEPTCPTLSERGKQAVRFISGEKEERMEGGRVRGREMCAVS